MPAPWFVEVNGQKQGPYTSQQIMKLLMDGALKVESRIFDSAANAWKIASDVIPYLELENAPSPTRSHATRAKAPFSPPPKPTELRDVHVVGLNDDPTGNIDYFALINDQRKATVRTQSLVARAQLAREQEVERQRRAQSLRRGNDRDNLSSESRAEATKIVRVPPPIENEQPIKTALKSVSPSAEESPLSVTGTDGIITAEVEPPVGFGLGQVILLTRWMRRTMQEHRSAVSVAAALTFVFVGTYGTVRLLSERKSREPASSVEAEKAAPIAVPSSPAIPSSAVPTDGELGSGRNRILRHGGSVARPHPSDQHSRFVPPMPSPTVDGNRADVQRDPPQYYSSSDPTGGGFPENLPPPQQQLPPSPGQQTDYNAQNAGINSDPNNGVVNPPAYAPPNDPNDPNRFSPGQTTQ